MCITHTLCPFPSAPLAQPREEQESELRGGILVCQGLNLNFLTPFFRSRGKARCRSGHAQNGDDPVALGCLWDLSRGRTDKSISGSRKAVPASSCTCPGPEAVGRLRWLSEVQSRNTGSWTVEELGLVSAVYVEPTSRAPPSSQAGCHSDFSNSAPA